MNKAPNKKRITLTIRAKNSPSFSKLPIYKQRVILTRGAKLFVKNYAHVIKKLANE